MWPVLQSVSPDTWAALFGLLATFATWLYHDIRGDKQDSLLDNLKGLGKQAIHVLATDPAVTAAIDPQVLQLRAAKLLTRLAEDAKLPVGNTLAQGLIAQVAQHVVGDVLAELRSLGTKPVTPALSLVSGDVQSPR